MIWSTLEPSLALPGRGVCWGVAEAFSISLLTAPPRQPPPEGTGPSCTRSSSFPARRQLSLTSVGIFWAAGWMPWELRGNAWPAELQHRTSLPSQRARGDPTSASTAKWASCLCFAHCYCWPIS